MIRLELFTSDDFNELISWITSEEFLHQWAGPNFSFPLNKDQLETYIKDANGPNSTKLIYKVVDEETKSTVGHISLGNIDFKNKSARIGRVLVGKSKGRGQGLGQQMLKEIVSIAFQQYNLHRVSLGVFDFNIPAIKCYEKVGFKKEGLLRDYMRFGDKYWSMWEMSMLQKEWEEILSTKGGL